MNTSTTIADLNALSDKQAFLQFEQACCAPNWVKGLVNARPFVDQVDLLSKAKQVWQSLSEEDFLAAFDGHPMIGDVSTLKEKYRNTQSEASHEQSGVNQASDEVIAELAARNKEYFDKFGFIFIVFATGKSAQQMLDLLMARLPNTRSQEIANAAAEQAKITELRLEKML